MVVHDTCHYTAANGREFLMEIRSFSLILHFPFFHPQSERFHSGESNTFSKTNQENVYVFGWKYAILLHNSGPAWLTPSLLCHRSVHLCVYCVFLQLSLPPFTYFPNKITDSIQKFEVQFVGWKSKCEGLSDEVSRQGSRRDSEPCTTCLSVFAALRWLWISSIAASWGRPGSATAVKAFLVLICWDSVDTGGELRDVCAVQENKEQSTWHVWGCSFRLQQCVNAFSRFCIWIIHRLCI